MGRKTGAMLSKSAALAESLYGGGRGPRKAGENNVSVKHTLTFPPGGSGAHRPFLPATKAALTIIQSEHLILITGSEI